MKLKTDAERSARDDEIYKMRLQGTPIKKIAEAMGCSKVTVFTALKAKPRIKLPKKVRCRKYNTQAERDREKARHRSSAERRARAPEKYRARAEFSNAIRSGKVIRQPCSVCGDSESEGHHPDYSKPLDVIWLCIPHHNEEHRRLRRAQQ